MPTNMNITKKEPRYTKPIPKKLSLATIAYDSIREAIITGRIKPGERMGQVEFAHELEVSERTVREAFARLAAKGLIVHEPFKGVRVAALPLNELHEVYLMRALLEGRAMELAASRISPKDLQKMRELLPKTEVGNTSESVKQAQTANRDFHWIAIRASGSDILAMILEQLWELMFAYDLLYQNTDEVDISKNDYTQHNNLIAALMAGDGSKAAQINTEHITKTIQILMAHLSENAQTSS
ncbi:MAG: GntR family transcriptional regulator [Chloroflexi bacterium]|nr:GntR family transcriptional regulator [Chloroflexota bacterium]